MVEAEHLPLQSSVVNNIVEKDTIPYFLQQSSACFKKFAIPS